MSMRKAIKTSYVPYSIESSTSVKFKALKIKLEAQTGGIFTSSKLLELLLKVYEESEATKNVQ